MKAQLWVHAQGEGEGAQVPSVCTLPLKVKQTVHEMPPYTVTNAQVASSPRRDVINGTQLNQRTISLKCIPYLLFYNAPDPAINIIEL
mmetsp:Transcript_94829/g.163664  ORF Transcript_94829/g.163664 Transcript_94829/m.163664 type:complete len:88 (-) Transcript_94829:654-917(-)